MYLESAKQFQMFQYSKSVKQYIVLGTDTKAVSNLVHIAPDIISIDDCCTTCGGVQT